MAEQKNHTTHVAEDCADLPFIPPPHPGEIIRRRFFDTSGMSQTEICRKFGLEKTKINRLLCGKKDVSVDDSRDLGRAFNVNPLFFLDLQIKYNDAKRARPVVFAASLEEGDISTEVQIKK